MSPSGPERVWLHGSWSLALTAFATPFFVIFSLSPPLAGRPTPRIARLGNRATGRSGSREAGVGQGRAASSLVSCRTTRFLQVAHVCLSLPGLAVPGHAADMTRLFSGHPEPERKKRLATKTYKLQMLLSRYGTPLPSCVVAAPSYQMSEDEIRCET